MSRPTLRTMAISLGITLITTFPAWADSMPTGFDMDETVIAPSRIERRRSESPTHVTVLGRQDLAESSGRTIDDTLRHVPGFSLFRRSSSVVAHPTTQGASLRGIGPSGASRTVVVHDGIPLNDPFGGWVYWSRVPLSSIRQIEVVRGGGSTAWGSGALGGVIDVESRRASDAPTELRVSGGTHGTVDIDGIAGRAFGPFSAKVAGRYFETNGYKVIRKDQRGPIDIEADSRVGTFDGEIAYAPSDAFSIALRGNFFDEVRGNGTPLTGNDTTIGLIALTTRVANPSFGTATINGYGQFQTFASRFSAQEEDRSAERPALDQFDVPSRAAGGSIVWSLPAFGAHELTAGADLRWVRGETNEAFFFSNGEFTRQRRAGGRQLLVGGFVEDSIRLGDQITIGLGARIDSWTSSDLERFERDVTSGQTLRDDRFADRDEIEISPRATIVARAHERVTLRGAFYEGFRAPTLNELVRPFRVRNDITAANAELRPESVLGGEVGADVALDRVLLRATGFWSELDDPVANVSIGTGPGLVGPCGFVPGGGTCRQRRNLGQARVRGVESEIAVIPAEGWLASASHLYSDAEITDAPEAPQIEGRRILQVPRHQIGVRLAYRNPELLDAALALRWVSSQFEDDLNRQKLEDFTTLDLRISRKFGEHLELFVAAENIAGAEIEAGKTGDGLVTLGTPRMVHGGARLTF